jgi:hypothetical protein
MLSEPLRKLGIGDFTVFQLVLQECGGDDKNAPVLAPLDRNERALAFQALTGALALLAGVTPPSSSAATEAAMDESISATPQYCDHHKSGVVVHLSKRIGAEDV